MKNFKLILLFWGFMIFSLPAEALKEIDRVVAVVNNRIITLYELDRTMVPKLGSIQKSIHRDQAFHEAKREALNKLIEQILMEQAVEKAAIEITDDDLARAIQSVLHQNRITIDELKSELASKGVSYESYKSNLKKEIKQIKFIQQNLGMNVQVSEKEVEDFLESRNKTEKKTTVTFDQISLPLKEGVRQKELKKALAEAQEITDNARKTGSFFPLATTPVGPVSTDEIPAKLAEALRSAEIGTITDPISTMNNILIAKLNEKKTETVSNQMGSEEAYQLLYKNKMDQEMNHYLLKLRQKAYIDIRE